MTQSKTKAHEASSKQAIVLDGLLAAHRQFLAFLEKHAPSREDAEDILQDAYAKVMEKADELRRAESARAWFFRLLRRALTDRHRLRAARDRGEQAQLLQEVSTEDLESNICRCIEHLLPALPDEQARLLRRVELDGIPVLDEAKALAISPNAVSARLLRARRALFRELQQSCRVCAVHGCLDCHC